MLQWFGHSIGYHVAEELETDLAMTISDKKHATPDGVLHQKGLSTGLAFDNYDENTETLSGANTLHDTVGIEYQDIVDTADDDHVDDAQVPADGKQLSGDVGVQNQTVNHSRKHSLTLLILEALGSFLMVVGQTP